MSRAVEDSIPTRSSLLRRLKDWDDQRSWQVFYDTYWRLIYGVARKAGLTETEAEDATQETIITVAKKMRDFRYDRALGSFKGYLVQTTRWRIGDQLRRRPREGPSPSAAADDPARTSTVERVPDPASLNLDAVWDQDWSANLIEAAVERLKGKVNAKDYQVYAGTVGPRYAINDYLSTCILAESAGNGPPQIVAIDQSGLLYVLSADLEPQRTNRLFDATQGRVQATFSATCDLDGDQREEHVLLSFEEEHVSGDNPGTRAGLPTVRHAHDVRVVVLDAAFKRIADYQLAATLKNTGGLSLWAGRLEKGEPNQILVLGDRVLVLEFVRAGTH